MNIGKPHLQQAVEQQIISRQQADALWRFWQSQQNEVPQFRFNHVLYYIGGLLAIGAMTLFMTLGWKLSEAAPSCCCACFTVWRACR